MKKFFAALLLTALLVAPAAADVVLQLGFENSMSEPIGQALAKWKELLAARNTGLTMEIFPDSQQQNRFN